MIYIIGQNALTTTGISYIVSKRHELRSTNGFKLDRQKLGTKNFYICTDFRWYSERSM